MAPVLQRRIQTDKPIHQDALVLEAWAQGYLVGSLVIMAFITVANMRSGVLLHKLILVELILGMFHGTFIFTHEPVYGWYLSVTAILLNISWTMHNVISWMKSKPFLSRYWRRFYIVTLALAQPYWVIEIYANFTFFNRINSVFVYTRPYEAIFRDPWWIFSAINLIYNITSRYGMPLTTVVRISPRFGVLLVALTLSMAFIIVDVCAVTGVFDTLLPDGLNPFWKLATVFKALTDSIVLDDFKTALDRLMRHKLQREAVSSDTWTNPARLESEAPLPGAPVSNHLELPSRLDLHNIEQYETTIWRTRSLTTAPDEDPLGDDSNDRARNRANAEPKSPFDRANKMNSMHSSTMKPLSPSSHAKSALGRPPSTLSEEVDLVSLEIEIASHAGRSASTVDHKDETTGSVVKPSG